MRNFEKAFSGLAAHTLRGRIRRDQLGVGSLKRFQFLHQAVKVRITQFGCIQDVIQVSSWVLGRSFSIFVSAPDWLAALDWRSAPASPVALRSGLFSFALPLALFLATVAMQRLYLSVPS